MRQKGQWQKRKRGYQKRIGGEEGNREWKGYQMTEKERYKKIKRRHHKRERGEESYRERKG